MENKRSRKETYYKNLFRVAALWNWAIAAQVLFSSRKPKKDVKATNSDPIYLQVAMSLVAVFGLGYFWVSRNLDKNRNIVKLAVIGKTIVFLVLLRLKLMGKASVLNLVAGIGDLIFAGLFTDFLLKTQDKAK